MKKSLLSALLTFLLTSRLSPDSPWSTNVQVSVTTGNESTIAVFYPNIYISYNGFPEKFRMSIDGGSSWQTETSFPGSCCDGSMYADELGFIHISILFNSPSAAVKYYRSTDNGSGWTAPITLNSGGPLTSVDKDWLYNTKNRIYVAWVEIIFGSSNQNIIRLAKSTDRGLTFSPQVQVNDGNTFSFRQWPVVREDPKDSNIVYVSMTWDRRNFGTGTVPPWQVFVAKSTDGGNTWLPNVALPDTGRCIETTGNPPFNQSTTLAVSPLYNDVYVAWVDQLPFPPGGYPEKLNVFFSRSTNGGVSFEPRIKIPALPNPDISYHFQPWIECDRYGIIHLVWYDTRGYPSTPGTRRKGTYYTYSTNRGITWAPEERVSDTTDSFYNIFIGHYLTFTTDPLRIYSTWTDVRNGTAHVYYSWRFLPIIPVTIQQNNNNIPKTFKLNQNFPNPFNASTKIKIQVSELSDVNLTVYDISGREITTLVNKGMKPGSYEIGWDGTDYSSGVYYYRLIATDYTETKKMVLVK